MIDNKINHGIFLVSDRFPKRKVAEKSRHIDNNSVNPWEKEL